MSRLWYTSCIVIVAMTAFGAPQGDDPVYKEVIVYPNAKKNKAFPLKAGSASFCDLKLRPETPWRIRKSDIAPSDDKIFWYKISDAEYGLAYAYADKEYAVINGDLYKPGNGGGGKGNPAYPPFTVTVPEVNLQWGADHGDASKEEKEDTVPAVLVVSESKNLFGRLLVHPPKDDFSIETRKCRVTLLWSPADAVKVFKDGTEIGTKTAFDFDSSDAKPVELDVCAVKSAVDVKFTLEGEPDNVNKDRAVDYVHAKCVTLNFEVESDAKYDYDKSTKAELIDNRTATITVETTPKGVDVTDLGITFEAHPAEKGELVNCSNKFDVVIAHKAGNQWKTKDVVYWYGVKPNRIGYNERFKYVFDLKYKGDVLKSKQLSVRWPEYDSAAAWISPMATDNATTVGVVTNYPHSITPYWYCIIDFKEFFKRPVDIFTFIVKDVPYRNGKGIRDFHDTSQYSVEILKEERYHKKQFLGDVAMAEGGLRDCYTVKGLQYFVDILAKEYDYVKKSSDESGPFWMVQGESRAEALEHADFIIREAIKREVSESNSVKDLTSGYMELKAKEFVAYNAAWLYEYTYVNRYGQKPKRKIHKAYQKPQKENFETR